MPKIIIGKNGNELQPLWEKGESGNPNGRPNGRKSLKTIIRDYLDSPASKAAETALNERGITKAQALVLQQLIKACEKGELPSAAWITETAEPKEEEHQGASLNITLNAADLKDLSERVQAFLVKRDQPKEVVEVKAEETIINPCNMP